MTIETNSAWSDHASSPAIKATSVLTVLCASMPMLPLTFSEKIVVLI